MTFLRPGNTMSGEPGRSRRWTLYLYPAANRIFLTINSGAVSRCFTRFMRSETLLRTEESSRLVISLPITLFKRKTTAP